MVQTAVEKYLKPFLIGRNADEIEDIWQSNYVSSYWRNGPVLFNAMSGVDMALWDIKGKRANMPVYQLLGGKCRIAADLYAHPAAATSRRSRTAGGRRSRTATATSAIQVAVPGLATYGASRRRAAGRGRRRADEPHAGVGVRSPTSGCSRSCSNTCARSSATTWSCSTTSTSGSRSTEGVQLCKELERYHPYFIEDPFPPEQNEHFRMLRQQTSVPIAMGELFNTQHEYVPLIADRLIDFIRVHISQIGGLTMARKVARAVRVLRRAHGLARPGRRLAGRPRGPARAGAGQPQLRHPRGRRLRAEHARGLPRLPRDQERRM